MLKDIERKTLRIIANFLAIRRRTPTIHEIGIKTGRNYEGVIEVLTMLAQERYLEWSPDDPELIILLEEYERKPLMNNTFSGSWRAYGSN